MEVDIQQARYDGLVESINVCFLIILSIIVFIMQMGFAFLEAGSVRAKNTTNIIVKNIIDSSWGALAYWTLGYAFAFGSDNNAFIGTDKFFLINTDASEYSSYFFAYVFAVTASTIVSGALAERTRLLAYFWFTAWMNMWIYPVVSHWVWSDSGWLSELGYVDYAGSSVVHVVGGAGALAGAVIVGPRIGRFKNGQPQPIPGHSVVLLALGFFVLWFGFFAFNTSSEGGIAGDYRPDHVARAAVTTALAGSAAIVGTMFLTKLGFSKVETKMFGKEFQYYTIFGGYWSINAAINGGLTGMVAICAGCDIVEPWAGFVIGVVSSAVYVVMCRVLLILQIDDPVTATPIHLFGGMWGVIAAVLFAHPDRLDQLPEGGIVYAWNDDAFILLGVQLVGVMTILCWSLFWSCLVFGVLRLMGALRVSAEQETEGLDFANGESAYPMDPAILAEYEGGSTGELPDEFD